MSNIYFHRIYIHFCNLNIYPFVSRKQTLKSQEMAFACYNYYILLYYSSTVLFSFNCFHSAFKTFTIKVSCLRCAVFILRQLCLYLWIYRNAFSKSFVKIYSVKFMYEKKRFIAFFLWNKHKSFISSIHFPAIGVFYGPYNVGKSTLKLNISSVVNIVLFIGIHLFLELIMRN